MLYPIKLGLRGLLRHPRTLLLAVATLALGLAATMTMLTLLAMLSADPLPGISQRLYLGWVESREAKNSDQVPDPRYDGLIRTLWKLDDVQALLALQPGWRQSALVSTPLQLSTTDNSETAYGPAVLALGPGPSMFGLALRHGRYWTAQEEQQRIPVVVIDYRTSLKLFGREDGTGQSLRIGRNLFQVIGISDDWAPKPALHALQNEGAAWQSQSSIAWVPALAALEAEVTILSTQLCDDSKTQGMRFNELDTKACRWLSLWAELENPAQVAQFRQQLLEYARQRHADGVFQREPAGSAYSVAEWLRFNRVVPDTVRLNLWLALALLALCLVNVAGLLAARLLRRAGELGVRRVLGANRAAVVVQCLVEAGGTGLLGGLLALPLTLFGLWLVRMQERDYSEMAQFQPGLFAVLLALALVCGLLVGLLPAWRAARLQPALQVKSL